MPAGFTSRGLVTSVPGGGNLPLGIKAQVFEYNVDGCAADRQLHGRDGRHRAHPGTDVRHLGP